MAQNSKIEWTEATWNPVVGCEKVSPGCAHCYAELMAARLKAMALADLLAGRDPGRKKNYIDAIDARGRWSGKLIPVPEALADPHGWRRPRNVFVNSMSDLFHETVPDWFIDEVFATCAVARQHTFQILTKRADRAAAWFAGLKEVADEWAPKTKSGRFTAADVLNCRHLSRHSVQSVGQTHTLGRAFPDTPWPLSNVWMGTSVENAACVDRVKWLKTIPAAVRFLSVEPLLGPIPDLPLDGIHWVIVGGESGPGARPMAEAWALSIRDQCVAAGVPFFFKQWGGVNKSAAGRTLDGRTWDEMPARPLN